MEREPTEFINWTDPALEEGGMSEEVYAAQLRLGWYAITHMLVNVNLVASRRRPGQRQSRQRRSRRS